MNGSGIERKSRPVVSSAATMRLSGSRLIIGRTVWLVLVVPSLGLFVAGIPAYYARLQTACVGSVACNVAGALTAKGLYALVRLAVIFSQVYRYRRVSTPVERQKTKWAVMGILIVVAGFVVLGVLNGLFPALNQPDTPYYLISNIAYPLLLLTLPLSIGIAILRYRLYDIDVLINRTLVYGTLTVLLTLVYFGLVIGLESLVRLLTGQTLQSPLIIVASTLAIAALFQPLRRSIQRIIDRRFYRRKYDAARILAVFSSTLRNEVELSQLSEHLIAVVQETMQPAHVSLWLRSPGRDTEEPLRLE